VPLSKDGSKAIAMAEVGGASGSGEPRCAPPPRSPPTEARPAEREQDPAETEAPETAATGAAVDGWAEDEPAAAFEHSLPPLGGPNVDQGDEGGRGAGGAERGGDEEDRDSDGRFYRSVVEQHYARLGYRVHSGLQFGTDFVLYRDDPSLVHSEYCVRVVPPGKRHGKTRGASERETEWRPHPHRAIISLSSHSLSLCALILQSPNPRLSFSQAGPSTGGPSRSWRGPCRPCTRASSWRPS
jgi:hypothetical protein